MLKTVKISNSFIRGLATSIDIFASNPVNKNIKVGRLKEGTTNINGFYQDKEKMYSDLVRIGKDFDKGTMKYGAR